MKIRTDFVTNSSSSSFVIAKHKDYKREEFENLIEKNDTTISLLEKYHKMSKEEIISEIDDNFNGSSPDIVIGDWGIYGGNCGDGYGVYGEFLYYANVRDSEHFKMRHCDWYEN